MLTNLFSGGLLFRWVNEFRQDPRTAIISLLIEIPALLFALILHEVAHGYVALRCGDGTAKMMGRLSLLPSRHLDPIGSLCLVLFGFGWAKPVPVNPRNYKRYVLDDFLVSIAGITMNMLLFLVFSFLMSALVGQLGKSEFVTYLFRFCLTFASLNLTLAVFNLLPIPPLDGYHIFNDLLLKGRLNLRPDTMRIIQFAFIAVCFATNIVSSIIGTVTGFIWNNVVTFYLRILY